MQEVTDMPRWEHYPHDADMGVRGIGNTLDQAFEQAMLALTAIIVDPDQLKDEKQIHIQCSSDDIELLFTDWLNEIIYHMATDHLLFHRAKIKITNGVLNAQLWGEVINVDKHQPTVEVKGATFTTLKVEQLENNEWLAQTVVDV